MKEGVVYKFGKVEVCYDEKKKLKRNEDGNEWRGLKLKRIKYL